MDKSTQQLQDEKLGTAPLGKLIIGMALPAVAAQIVNVLYNIVDRMYIGHMPEVGAQALTGLGICFPIIMLISAFSSFAGAGGAPLAAIQLGRGSRENAEKILANAVIMLLVFAVVLTIVFMIFKRPFLYAFGGSEDTIQYALDYLNVYLYGTIFVQIALGLNMFIICQGNSATAMLSVVIGAVINIILDPVFIFGLNMGVQGAALATVISQACSSIWILHFLISKKTSLRIKLMTPNLKVIGGIAALGISPFVMQSTESLISIAFNSNLQRYGGDLYVGSMTILQSIMQLIVIPIQGFTQGTQPIISYNFGARNHERVKKTFKIMLTGAVVFTAISCLATIRWPELFARIFTSDTELIDLIKKVLPIYIAGMSIFGVQMACQTSFMGMGQAKISLFLALFRKVILLIPLIFLLPIKFGVIGIYYAEPISDILAATVTGSLFLFNFNKILEKGR